LSLLSLSVLLIPPPAAVLCWPHIWQYTTSSAAAGGCRYWSSVCITLPPTRKMRWICSDLTLFPSVYCQHLVAVCRAICVWHAYGARTYVSCTWLPRPLTDFSFNPTHHTHTHTHINIYHARIYYIYSPCLLWGDAHLTLKIIQTVAVLGEQVSALDTYTLSITLSVSKLLLLTWLYMMRLALINKNVQS
jgi:hypothetical protein